MTTVALIAASLAGLVLAAVGIRVYFLVKRLERLADQVGEFVASEAGPTVRALGDTARGARGAAEKLEEGLGSLASTLGRVDRLTAELEPDSIARRMVEPVVAKIVSWIMGVRKGLRAVRKEKSERAEAAEGSETETG
jgi:hypothetical protein